MKTFKNILPYLLFVAIIVASFVSGCLITPSSLIDTGVKKHDGAKGAAYLDISADELTIYPWNEYGGEMSAALKLDSPISALYPDSELAYTLTATFEDTLYRMLDELGYEDASEIEAEKGIEISADGSLSFIKDGHFTAKDGTKYDFSFAFDTSDFQPVYAHVSPSEGSGKVLSRAEANNSREKVSKMLSRASVIINNAYFNDDVRYKDKLSDKLSNDSKDDAVIETEISIRDSFASNPLTDYIWRSSSAANVRYDFSMANVKEEYEYVLSSNSTWFFLIVASRAEADNADYYTFTYENEIAIVFPPQGEHQPIYYYDSEYRGATISAGELIFFYNPALDCITGFSLNKGK